jgi:hypothetical protein
MNRNVVFEILRTFSCRIQDRYASQGELQIMIRETDCNLDKAVRLPHDICAFIVDRSACSQYPRLNAVLKLSNLGGPLPVLFKKSKLVRSL